MNAFLLLALVPLALGGDSSPASALPPDLARAFERARADERTAVRPDRACGAWTVDAGTRVRFEEGAVVLGVEGGRPFRLELARFGRAGAAEPVAAAREVAVSGRRIEQRRGALVEWYQADPRGLEQGFTLDAPPRAGDVRELELVLALERDLEVEILPGARDALLRDPRSGDVVHCSGLVAWDAGGRALDARLARAEDGLAILVDDRGASHPLTIDPLLALQRAKLVASDDAAQDQLGTALALDGDTAVVGSPFSDTANGQDSGAAYLFVRSGGVWSQQAKLIAPDGDDFAMFGASVALDGDRVLIGAPEEDFDGAAFTFVRAGSTWMREAKLTAPPADLLADDHFGGSVALDGDTALVAHTRSSIIPRPPRVYTRGPQGWDAGVDLPVAPSGTAVWHESTVALSGDLALVGAPRWVQSTSPGNGAAFAYVRAAGVWTLEAELVPVAPMADARFGASVDLEGQLALIGSPYLDLSGVLRAGAAYVFRRNGGAWAEEARLVAPGSDPGTRLGQSVALSGNVALVCAPGATAAGQNDAGEAYLFENGAFGWHAQGHLRADDAAAFDAFGFAAALDGTTALVGAPLEGHDGNDDAGAAYVFELVQSALSVCDGADGALSTCPCGNAGDADSGCDNAAATGGVQLSLLGLDPVTDFALLAGRRFPATSQPTVVVLRGDQYLDSPVALGDGLRCVGGPIVRVASGLAVQGRYDFTLHHAEGTGTYLYQLWYRSNPASYCTPSGFNSSNGVVLTW